MKDKDGNKNCKDCDGCKDCKNCVDCIGISGVDFMVDRKPEVQQVAV